MKEELTDYDYIITLLRQQNFHFSKAFGQNFLSEKTVVSDILNTASPDWKTDVLEIGPGIGTLTIALADKAHKVVAVERDERLKPILQKTLAGKKNVELLFNDILKTDIPSLTKNSLKENRRIVCANIPYSITTPLIAKLLQSECFSEMVLMVQKEVAERICASAGTKAYSAFTILCQWYAQCTILRIVPASCFIPEPKVDSAVIKMEIRREEPCPCESKNILFTVVQAAFNQRRKTLSNALYSKFPEISKDEISKMIQSCGLPPDIRGERLTLQEFAEVSDALAIQFEKNIY